MCGLPSKSHRWPPQLMLCQGLDPPALNHLSSTPYPMSPPLPTLAGASCSISEVHCGLMGFTFLASYQGKSWKCPGLEILFLASQSPLRTILSAREAQSSWWVMGLEARAVPWNIWASRLPWGWVNLLESWLGRAQDVWGRYRISPWKSLCHSQCLHS